MEKITSRRNPLCVHLKKLGANRSYRESCSEFLCDGLKLLEDAVDSGANILTVLTATQLSFPLPVDTRVYYAERHLIDSLSPLKNAQELLFSCSIPEAGAFIWTPGTHVLLDGVQDPSNVGAIIRSANAFGIESVILTGGCADPYNPKAIRASMGAIYRQNIYNTSIPELVKLKEGANKPSATSSSCNGSNVRFIGTAPGKGYRDASEVDYNDSLIVVGSEGRGLCESVLSLCDEMITIPISPECESLNAAIAASIIMWEARRV